MKSCTASKTRNRARIRGLVGRRLLVLIGLVPLAVCASCGSVQDSTPRARASENSGGSSENSDRPTTGRVNGGSGNGPGERSGAVGWTGPSPALTPEQVVKLQLHALRNNGDEGGGIAAAYEFSSPGNRAQTGPFEQFAETVKQPHYRGLFEYASVELSPTQLRPRRAHQLVYLKRDDGRIELFLFVLTKQVRPPYEDCWMTEAVYPAIEI